MNIIETLHASYIPARRISRLSTLLAAQLPPDARVLDVGCGDGSLARLLSEKRPDIHIRGIDVLVRSHVEIPVEAFDGLTIPMSDHSFDVLMFVDVLHHANDAMALLREAARVSRASILIKDHLCDSVMSGHLLKFMDRVGNERNGVALPFNYWQKKQWADAFRQTGLRTTYWSETLKLYPIWGDWLFGGGLHFLAQLAISQRSPDDLNQSPDLPAV